MFHTSYAFMQALLRWKCSFSPKMIHNNTCTNRVNFLDFNRLILQNFQPSGPHFGTFFREEGWGRISNTNIPI